MKKITSGLMLGVFLFFSLIGAQAANAASASNNGMTYILLPSADGNPDYIVRLQHQDPSGVITPQAQLYAPGSAGYPGGDYFGLAVSQEREIFLLRAPVMGADEGWTQAAVGYLPNASDYSADSDIFLKMIAPSDCSTWQSVHGSSYWKNSYTIGGTTYSYAMQAGGPDSVSHLNPNGTGSLGTPLWDGSAGSPHPTDSSKYILPSHWGGMAYYAYGTSQHPDYPWKQLDGREDPAGSGKYRPLVLATEVPRKHGSDVQKFSCIVKRVYEKRDRSLILMRGSDNPLSSLTDQSGSVLSATDVRATEYFARACGDNCIPGGSGPGVAIDSTLAVVKVVTSTLGRRYGFNQKGKMREPYSDTKLAALRVVSTAGEFTIDMANADGTVHSNIANAAYLNARGITASEIKSFGVSSNFAAGATVDFIYGSPADFFAMQDSWWGKGGIGYEYYKETGELYKLDFTNNTNPSPEYLGILTDKIDSIGVDGDGFLYIMTTEPDISNAAVMALSPAISSLAGDSSYAILPSTTSWYRTIVSGETTTRITVSDSAKQNNDYREIVYFQGISKVVSKYPPSAGNGNLAAPTTTGRLSGYYADEWTRKVRWNGSNAAWEGSWSVEPVASRDSEIQAELAVVNIAKVPAVFNENPGNPQICREDKASFVTAVAEDSSVKLKIEGLRPYIADTDGTARRDLKPMGDFGTAYTNVKINYLPTAAGEYNHDEDNNGVFSGFPTSLFEAGGFSTSITWYADLVDGTTPDSPVISHVAVASLSNETFNGVTCDWSFIPPHPGNYAVWSSITYNCFNFAGANRPTDLTTYTRSATSDKRLLRVVSSTSLNGPPSLISAINLEPARGASGPSGAFQSCTSTSEDSGYDLPEDQLIENLKISFKGQFLRDANYRSNQTSQLTTYDGMGVWDYDAYCDLYNAAGETLNYTKMLSHVYNHQSSGTGYTVTASFNPGWPKPDNAAPANCGTRSDTTSPSVNDLKYLRWNLWLENTCTGANIPGATVPFRGVRLASGDCTAAVVQSATNPSEYNITLNLPSAAQAGQRIATPLDPDQYTLRLELIYPRVKWQESSLAEDPAQKQYRSIIPDDVPVSAICELSHPLLPTSDTVSGGGSAFSNASVKSWLVRVRDNTLPTISDWSKSIIHTTGDPVPDVTASFTISDNNPRAEFGVFETEYEMANSARPRDPTSRSTEQSSTTNTPVGQMPVDPDFWKNDNYRVGATYTSQVTDYGPTGEFKPGGLLTNWVGLLNYHAKGSLRDGLGVDALNTNHLFGSFTVTLPPTNIVTTNWALERFDNDPPGFRVELVSQNDNRRWVATLTEGVQDDICLPMTEADLASTTLDLSCYNLDGTIIGGGPTTGNINGCARYPSQIGAANETVDAGTLGLDAARMPRVRRSSRLLINIDVLENVDYQNLTAATFDITETLDTGSTRSLLPDGQVSLPLEAAFLADSSANPQIQSPRARYTVDMPMKVLPSQPQVRMTVSATDAQGNIRTLVLPIEIVDSSFDARVLESKENRR